MTVNLSPAAHRVLLELAQDREPASIAELRRRLGHRSEQVTAAYVSRLFRTGLVVSEMRCGQPVRYELRADVVVGEHGFVGRVMPLEMVTAIQEHLNRQVAPKG